MGRCADAISDSNTMLKYVQTSMVATERVANHHLYRRSAVAIHTVCGATENAGMENAGLENVGPNRMAGKGRTGKRGNIVCMGSET